MSDFFLFSLDSVSVGTQKLAEMKSRQPPEDGDHADLMSIRKGASQRDEVALVRASVLSEKGSTQTGDLPPPTTTPSTAVAAASVPGAAAPTGSPFCN